ncbi:hypothetical protein [Stackebrandtia soli]|uniref:hypothetical protein n=1 Tax=Stackebrandtia soli TaxID=1892856 RepID=UPI0039E78AFD
MAEHSDATSTPIVVRESADARDLLWLLVALGVIAGVIWLIASGAGSELITTRDPRTGLETESPAWIGIPILAFVALAWPTIRLGSLLARPTMAVVDATGVRLHKATLAHLRSSEPTVEATWDAIDRVVVWRLHTGRLGPVSTARTLIGLELSNDYYEIHKKSPGPKDRESTMIRRSGVPKRLGVLMKTRSVAASSRQIRDLADAVARFAPDVPVVNERTPGGGPAEG